MKTEYLIAIIISAFLHALYNIMIRRTEGNINFLPGMFFFAGICSIGALFVTGSYRAIPWHNLPYVYSASLFYVIYLLFTAKSYEEGSISANYPLTVLSPIFIPIWAFIFLSERISMLTACGILITVFGALILKIRSLSLDEFKNMFRMGKGYTSARFALAASFIYSFAAILDKSKIAAFTLPAYLALLLPFMFINFLFFSFFLKEGSFTSYISENILPSVTGGVIVFLSFFTFRIALQKIDVSIAVPVRQISIVFALLMGITMLKEPFVFRKVLGAILIMLGIAVVNIGL